MKPLVRIIIDSGAFSAYTQKTSIDIDAYAKFVLRNSQHLSIAVNLDVIYPEDSKIAAEGSYRNFEYLKDKGCVTMPVYHAGETIDWLDKYMEECDYIGLGASMISVKESHEWYDLIFAHATDSDGYPVVRFHAFGDTTPQTLLNYPWFSADSTTWVMAAGRAGRVFLQGKTIQFRARAAKAYNFISDNDEGLTREAWENEFRLVGLDPNKCLRNEMRESDIMLVRTYLNAYHFLELEKQSASVDRFVSNTSLLSADKKYGPGKPKTNPTRLCFVLTDSTAARALAVITCLGINNLLASKFFMSERQWETRLIPFLYDPVGTCMADEGIRREFDFLQSLMLEPVI